MILLIESPRVSSDMATMCLCDTKWLTGIKALILVILLLILLLSLLFFPLPIQHPNITTILSIQPYTTRNTYIQLPMRTFYSETATSVDTAFVKYYYEKGGLKRDCVPFISWLASYCQRPISRRQI